MKNTKTKIILSVIIFLSVAGFAGMVSAASPSLYVSPASLVKTVGSTFDVSIRVNTSGSKVCAVEGTLVFNNLSCQSIVVASDATPQSSPTCSNPHFLIGIPSCTTVDKALFTVSVKAGSAGISSISFTGVDIIGEGVSVGSTSISGNYTINAAPKSTTTTKPTVITTTTTKESMITTTTTTIAAETETTTTTLIPPILVRPISEMNPLLAALLGIISHLNPWFMSIIALGSFGGAVYLAKNKNRR